ncbi:uncharacterized protein LOC110099910 isoform X2 [Dendrobium catenatum]|uniref:uncharacterized protein LOC110099910 isoform X2 n=1 Tax=Dendrobium catenatum TaxID=906689 RepID=UPI0010A05999|nr:uncharacterized protein LOC110099910 isoform X2 [Dendrobium catenatum]
MLFSVLCFSSNGKWAPSHFRPCAFIYFVFDSRFSFGTQPALLTLSSVAGRLIWDFLYIKDFIVSEKEMVGRVSRNVEQVSPERCVVWTEPSGKHRKLWQQGMKVPVVYYLCKNSLMEHPHFIEVPLSSPEGLYLKDVINRLVVLRGNHMPTMYSWSCKRNGFVWQDLSENDLIIPALGNDYILKGSLLLDQASADGHNKSNISLGVQKNTSLRQNDRSLYSKNEEASSSLSSVTSMRQMKPLTPTPLASPHQQGDDKSLPSDQNSTPVIGSSSSGECMDLMPSGALAVSNMVDDGGGKKPFEPSTQTTLVSTDNALPDTNFNEIQLKDVQANDGMREEIPEIPVSWNAGMGTLVSLIRAEVEKLDNFKVIDEKELQSNVKIKRTNALLQLISCGSILKKINIS